MPEGHRALIDGEPGIRSIRGITYLGEVVTTALFTVNSICTIVTVVSHDVTEMGRQATRLLFARIDGYPDPPSGSSRPSR